MLIMYFKPVKSLALVLALTVGGTLGPATMRGGAAWPVDVLPGDPRPLAETLEALGQHFGVFFTYDVALVAERETDFTVVEGEDLAVAIGRLLANTGLGYESFGEKYFVLFENSRRGRRDVGKLRRNIRRIDRLEQQNHSELFRADAQPFRQNEQLGEAAKRFNDMALVSGKVTDAAGVPLPGVTVRIGNGRKGVITDAQGFFSVRLANPSEALSFSYVGFAAVTRTVRRGDRIEVTLTGQEMDLPEVVIIGYGAVRADEVTSSIKRIEAGQQGSLTINTPHQWLQGRVAGVQVQGGNGEQGSFGSIRIRGASSMNASNEPLFVVDGMPVDNTPHAPGGFQPGRNPLNSLNPGDVESVTVLKDAAAGAIYGSRAANGVVLIETKKSRLYQRGELTYNTWFGIDQAGKKLEVFDAAGYQELVGEVAPWRLPELGDTDTDWQATVLGTAASHQHTLSYAAGSENKAYRLSAGYLDRNSTILGAGSRRLNLSANAQQRFWEGQLTVMADAKLTRMTDRFVAPSVLTYAYAFDPTQPVREEGNRWGGYFEYQNDLTIKNPLGEAAQVEDESRLWRLLAHLRTSYAPAFAPGLKATIYTGTDLTDGYRNLYAPATVRYQAANNGEYRLARQQRRSRLWESYLNYDRRLGNDRLGMALTMGYTYQHSLADYPEERYLGIENYDYAFGQRPGSRQQTLNGVFQENRLASFFGRGSFDWQNKYYLTASFRTDGSSRFSPANRWASFPALSAAWRIGQEKWLAKRPAWIGEMKLRAGWGITGNQEIGDFQYLPTFTLGANEVRFPFGDDYLVTARPNAVSDQLKWEQTTSTNLGFELSLFDNRLALVAEAYHAVTTDLLSRIVVPAGSNLSDVVLTNVGSIRNRGLEFSADAKLIDGRDWTWQLGVNVATNQNRVLTLGSAPDQNFRAISTGTISGGTGNTIQIYREGEPLNAFYVFAHKRDATGRPLVDGVDHNGDGLTNLADIYEDRNEDGRVDDRDKRAFNQPAPRLFGGLQSRLAYRRWGLNVSLRAQTGNYVYNNTAAQSESYGRILAEPELLNLPVSIRRFGFRTPQYFSDVYIEDASFLRLDALTVDYTIPHREGRCSSRFYATVENVFTLTAYRGLDPEIGNVSGNPNVPRFGIDDLVFPRSRSFVTGLNISF
jgi:iron complex outermembrane receptor protein